MKAIKIVSLAVASAGVAALVIGANYYALCAAAGLAAGFIFGNIYRARIERNRRSMMAVEVVRLKRFKSSVQALCDKLK